MSFFQEIKDLFQNEIINSPQYSLALLIKNKVIEEINRPSITECFAYQLDESLTNFDIQNLKLCLFVMFGFNVEINGLILVVDMKKFLL